MIGSRYIKAGCPRLLNTKHDDVSTNDIRVEDKPTTSASYYVLNCMGVIAKSEGCAFLSHECCEVSF